MEGPDLAIENVLQIARRPADFGQSRLERLGIWPGEPARLLEMDLEAGPFGGFVVLGAAECDHAIEHVLLAGGAALGAALARMVHEQDRSPLPPAGKSPLLHRRPGLGIVVAT